MDKSVFSSSHGVQNLASHCKVKVQFLLVQKNVSYQIL